MALFPIEDLTFTDVRHLPIVKQFAKQIGLVATVDAIVDTQMELSPGVCVLAIVLDSLSGRSPLYRLKEFFHEKDTELLLGRTECFSGRTSQPLPPVVCSNRNKFEELPEDLEDLAVAAERREDPTICKEELRTETKRVCQP